MRSSPRHRSPPCSPSPGDSRARGPPAAPAALTVVPEETHFPRFVLDHCLRRALRRHREVVETRHSVAGAEGRCGEAETALSRRRRNRNRAALCSHPCAPPAPPRPVPPLQPAGPSVQPQGQAAGAGPKPKPPSPGSSRSRVPPEPRIATGRRRRASELHHGPTGTTSRRRLRPPGRHVGCGQDGGP